ncbi:MAG: SPOR domain-containing protein [Nitrosomonas sp.]|nr:SPOR domain-containing protein [Nitrosomonas sp.]
MIEESKSRFDFYKILPGIDEPNAGSLSNSKEVAQTSPETDNVQRATNSFFLQIGSFKSAKEAEKVKAELAFLGMMAAIQSTESSDKGTWYRVRMGPFSDIHEIDQIRASLQENQIESNIIRLPTSSMP